MVHEKNFHQLDQTTGGGVSWEQVLYRNRCLDIHMSYPDVSMNYIKSPLFLDVFIEISKVK